MMILRISECFYSLEAVINTNKNGMLHLFHGFKKCVIERRIFELCLNISYQMVIRYYTIVLIEKNNTLRNLQLFQANILWQNGVLDAISYSFDWK